MLWTGGAGFQRWYSLASVVCTRSWAAWTSPVKRWAVRCRALSRAPSQVSNSGPRESGRAVVIAGPLTLDLGTGPTILVGSHPDDEIDARRVASKGSTRGGRRRRQGADRP